MAAPAFHSIVYPSAADRPDSERTRPLEFFLDLNLNQIVDSITARKGEYDLRALFFTPLRSVDAVLWRQEIMRELENPHVFAAIKGFEQTMRTMREHLKNAETFFYEWEKQRWFLTAVTTYCEAVTGLSQQLSAVELTSRGLSTFRDALARYAASERFLALADGSRGIADDLAAIRYCVLIRGLTVEVRHFAGEPDYSTAVEATFARFKRRDLRTHAFRFTERAEMNDVEAKILDGVARLFPEVFSRLRAFCERNQNFRDGMIVAFDREIQFYVAVLELVAPLRAAGLSFCLPRVVEGSKDVESYGGFDLALATKLLDTDRSVVTNDFRLRGRERIIVVSGPNQGGKTTFARTFGQLHYLASLGCLVPGTRAQLFLFDQLFTHFERAEKVENLRGKLQDDLVRVRDIFDHATARSVIVMNEIFTSTTLRDAILLSKRIAAKIVALDALCVWVTFVIEVASLGDETVSMVSTVAPDDPTTRTYKIVRAPANGLAYAMSIAEKYRLTYAAIQERLGA